MTRLAPAGRVGVRPDLWSAALDPDDTGLRDGWPAAPPAHTVAAAVPGYLQETFPGAHGVIWYWTEIGRAWVPGPGPVSVRFRSVSYRAEFWLDGKYLGMHEGSGEIDLDISEWRDGYGPGLLAVRLLNPTTNRIDGMVLAETPAANAFDEDGYWPGRLYNYGGITGPVDIVRHDNLEIVDVHVVAALDRGVVDVDLRIHNRTDAVVGVEWQCQVSAADDRIDVRTGTARVPAGGRRIKCTLAVPDPIPWSPDRPFLYDVDIMIVSVGRPSEPRTLPATLTRRVRTGFRHLTVDDDGFFVLNGRRIFIRSTHTGNHIPVGIAADRSAALLRTDLLNAKTVGLNMLRFIAGPATPEQLDLCDELGLMVYEECDASWPHGYAPGLETRFDTELQEMVRRDRNHPCVVVWGLLNETRDGPMFRHAASSLPLVRELDATRLVLLASGRWDGDLSIGSVCRLQRWDWEHLWGAETPRGGSAKGDPDQPDRLGYVAAVGDRHLYPQVPHSVADLELLATMGAGQRPIFLSEYGIGSLFNAVREIRELALAGGPTDLAEPLLMTSMLQRYLADFDRFGLAEVFAFPEDLFEDSYRTHSAHRNEGLNALRANPRLVGHNITGMLDHAVTGEGMWTFTGREVKPGVVDAVRDGLAPLRWCLGLHPVHSTVGTAPRLDISLADEGVLDPGRYPGSVRIMGANGPVWQHDLQVEVPGPSGAAEWVHPVLSTKLPADLGAGRYRVTAALHGAAAPRGRTADLVRSDPVGPFTGLGPVTLAVPDERLSTWLSVRGVTVRQRLADVEPDGTILLTAATDLPADDWRALWATVGDGATAVLLDAATSVESERWRADPPLPMTVERSLEWLYHTETIGLRHGLFAGLPGPGILDWSFYGQTLPRARLLSDLEPTEIAAVAIGVGLPRPGGYASGFVTAGWRLDTGRILTNTMRLVENLDLEPAADLLLANLLRSVAHR